MSENWEFGRTWECRVGGQPTEVAVAASGLIVFTGGRSEPFEWSDIADLAYPTPTAVLVSLSDGEDIVVEFATADVQGDFRDAVDVVEGLPTSIADAGTDGVTWTRVPPSRVTTLPTLPGFRIVRVVGVVAEVGSTSGWTAESKGMSALEKAMEGLRDRAGGMAADAVVGLTASSFGAHGGITNVVGGDAVGVLLLGTAVTVARDDERSPQTASPDH